MEQPDIDKRLSALEQKTDAIYRSTEKTRKLFLWTLIITLATILLPIIGLIIVVPMVLDTYVSSGLF